MKTKTMSKAITVRRFPKNIDSYDLRSAYGGIAVYRVSEEEASEIAREFPSHFNYKPAFDPREGTQLFYMCINRGERHVIFVLPSDSDKALR